MNAIVAAHAKKRPPSAAARWLHCPVSATVAQLYPNDESDASTKGDYAHYVLECSLLFGILWPHTTDQDVNDNVAHAVEWALQTRNSYGTDCRIIPEQQYDIPETGEFGTCDITLVSPRVLHIADYKNGFVIVDVAGNEQMLTYLCGAIAKYGPREQYFITVIQPNGSHIDGSIRTVPVSASQVDEHRAKIAWSIENEHIAAAGKWCKKSYCPHRGNCAAFLAFAHDNAADAYWPTDINAMTDEQLAEALDHADILQGLRDELRKAAMNRILQQNRSIRGYKTVKGRQDRQFKNEAPVKAVLADTFQIPHDKMHTHTFLSVKGVEDLIRAWARNFNFGRGQWQQLWENYIAEHVLTGSSGITLERATDARPSYRRGSEFGPIEFPGQQMERIVM